MCGTKFSKRRSLTLTPDERSSSSYQPCGPIKQERSHEGNAMQNAYPMLCLSNNNGDHSSQDRRVDAFKNGVLTLKNTENS